MENIPKEAPNLAWLRDRNPNGVVYFFALPISQEAIVLRAVSTDGRPLNDGAPYNVEFCHPTSGEVIESLEAEENRLYDSVTMHLQRRHSA